MAELAAVSSIAGLLSLTIQVIQISQRYISSVKTTSKTIKGYFRELEIMRLVLSDFERLVKQRNSPEEQSLDILMLESCSIELENLRSKLSKRSAANSVSSALNRLTWPFAEEETRQLVEVLHRYQASFHSLLSAQNFRLTASTLTAIEDVRDRQDQEAKERIVQWLSKVDPLINHTAARDKHEATTGEWFLNSTEYSQWRDNPANFLWIRGIPGAGKTILCSTIIDHLVRNQNADDFILFFYFDFRDEQKQKLSALLRSLIAQFCVRADNVPEEVRKALNHGGVSLNVHSLSAIFASLASSCGAIRIVIDAIDESSERCQVLEFLKDVSQDLKGTVQWLVTSRQEQDIEDLLAFHATSIVSLNNEAVDQDIRLHVNASLSRDSLLRSRPFSIKQQIIEVLTIKAHGMFRWVECQLFTLRSCLTAPAIETALANLPIGMDETYDRILHNIEPENRHYVRQALMLIAFSGRPLHVREIAEGAVIDGTRKPFDPGDRFFDSKDIVTLAAGLVVCDENTGTLALAHYSVQEYLLSPRVSQGQAREFELDEASCHGQIARICMAYMLSVAELTVGYQGIAEDFPLLEYASQNWLMHAENDLRNGQPETTQLCLHIIDGRKGAHRFWLTYYDHQRLNSLALVTLLKCLPAESFASFLCNPGFLALPPGLVFHGLFDVICVWLVKEGNNTSYADEPKNRRMAVSVLSEYILPQLKILLSALGRAGDSNSEFMKRVCEWRTSIHDIVPRTFQLGRFEFEYELRSLLDFDGGGWGLNHWDLIATPMEKSTDIVPAKVDHQGDSTLAYQEFYSVLEHRARSIACQVRA